MGEDTYAEAVAALSDSERSELHRGFNRIKGALSAYREGVTIDSERKTRNYIDTEDIQRYLDEHHPLSPPPKGFITRTLDLLDAVGAVQEHTGRYGIMDYTENDEEQLECVLNGR